MSLVPKSFEDVVTLTRPAPADYEDKDGNTQTAAANEPRFNYTAGDPDGLLMDSLLEELGALVTVPAFNPLEGTWVFDALAENCRPLPGAGFDELVTGDGVLVLVYKGGVGRYWSNGQILHTADPISPAAATHTTAGGNATLRRIRYLPEAVNDTEAAQLATGAFEIVTPPALLADLEAQEYGTRDETGAFQRKPYSGVLDLTRPGPTTAWDAQGNLVTVPAGQPAFDHDPLTGEPLGQQIVAFPVTNETAWSRLLSNWNGAGYAPVDNALPGIDGSQSMTEVELVSASDRRGLYDANGAQSYTNGQVRYLSAYFRRTDESVTTFAVGMQNGSTRFGWGAYDLVANEFSFVSYGGTGTFDLVSMENISGNLWRLEVKWTCGGDYGFRAAVNAGVGTAQELYNGANLLQSGTLGAGFVSVSDIPNAPYIPTDGTAETRPADICYSGTPFADRYNPERGSLLVEWALNNNGYALTVIGDDPANQNSFLISYDYLRVFSAGAAILNQAINNRGHHKALFSWGDGSMTIIRDGAVLYAGPGAAPTGELEALIFKRDGSPSYLGAGYLKQLQLSDQPVTEARGVELTTL